MDLLLDQCLSSFIVKPDLMKYLEVLVINDGSKDRSSEIAHSYELKYPETFKVIDKDNGNYGSCINTALSILTGRYIKVVDADDYVLTDGIESLIQFLSETDVDAVISNKQDVDARGDGHGFLTLPLIKGHTYTPDELCNGDVLEKLFIHSITYKSSLFETIKYKQTEGISYTDLEWIYYPMSVVNTIKFDPGIVYCYRHGREGQTVGAAQRKKSMWMEEKVIIQMFERYDDLVQKSGPSSRIYLERRLILFSARLYFYYLLEYDRELDENNLRNFDKSIEIMNPKIYYAMNSIECKTYFGTYKYIQNWRKRKSRYTLKFLIYDLYRSVSRIRHSLLKA